MYLTLLDGYRRAHWGRAMHPVLGLAWLGISVSFPQDPPQRRSLLILDRGIAARDHIFAIPAGAQILAQGGSARQ